MAIILRDILVTIDEADYTFANPLDLTNDASPSEIIGRAELEHRSDRIYASLYLEKDDTAYLDTYPKVIVDDTRKIIQSVALISNSNKDIRIERIKDQELFQSSSGAGNAEMA